MTFDDVDSLPVSQELKITANDLKKGSIIVLKKVKFQKVFDLTLFVESNVGDTDQTDISAFHCFGIPVQVTKMADLKKQQTEE